jgi:SAM-dependent methyltransferase
MTASVFDAVADVYDRARPNYPEAAIDDLVAIANLHSASRILEVGVGTGQATRSLARRGFSVLGLEPGSALAALARANLSGYPGITIVETSFEAWTLPGEAFDLLVSAAAFHWVDPEIRFAKAYAALKPGGTIAILANIPRRGRSDLDREIDACYERFAPSHRSTGAERRIELEPQFEGCGLFQVLPVRQCRWSRSYSADDYVELLRTYSDHHQLPPPERDALLDAIRQAIGRHGGTLELEYESRLLTGRRSR